MKKLIKNMNPSEVIQFADLISYQEGQVVSKTLAQNDAVSITIFAFDVDEEISTHESSGDALVLALDGEGKITIDGEVFFLKTGDSILMPAKHPHAVFATKQFKMLLTVVFPKKQD